ncbi:MAG: YraN family protein [Dokdonella sp.]|uniref:YraN family protein n=1 Tax=Dokdonella sp. TaxID=2291710 RepID=UPI002C799A11|nr:YraN family protein [Dokdonella sp.]HOX70953.1 YraN family protein [Dokdonella sp.]HPG93363.1 YraN family protein [Dokdonella sp.]HPN79007.1 YraN family protein [Dokdonella sp.]
MRTTGALFEDLALAHAERSGLQLLARNFNCRYGELDLILRERDVVVFLEVRYRRSQGFGGALDSVGAGKRDRLIKAASVYLQGRPDLARQACRFDVMAFSGTAQNPLIDWQRNAFEA